MGGRPHLAGTALGAGSRLRFKSATRWTGFFKTLRREWMRNNLSEAAAALTFYGVLALFPFLLLFVALAGLAIRPDRVQALVGALGREVPPAFTELAFKRIAELTAGPSRGLLTFSGVTAMLSASAGVVSLIKALNVAYGVAESRPRWKIYGTALGVVVVGAVLALLAALLTVAAPLLARKLGSPWETLVIWLRLPVAAILMMALWATLYSVLPNVRRRSSPIIPGSVAGVLVWLAASLAFSSYVSHFGTFGMTYGALGGVVFLLLWMFISALALMLGAQINAVLASRRQTAVARRAPG